MLKPNEWYFIPNNSAEGNGFKRSFLGYLNKVISVSENPNYCTIERWKVTNDRKYESIGVFDDADSVDLTKFGKKVNPPPKAFQVLYGQSVKNKSTTDQILDAENEYNEE